MNRFMRNIGFYLLIIFIAITFIDYFSVKNSTTKQEMGYSAFLQQVDKGEVAKVTMMNNVIEGVLTDGTEFLTVTPDTPNDATLLQRLQDKKVEIRAKNPPEPPWWTAVLSSVLPILLLAGV